MLKFVRLFGQQYTLICSHPRPLQQTVPQYVGLGVHLTCMRFRPARARWCKKLCSCVCPLCFHPEAPCQASFRPLPSGPQVFFGLGSEVHNVSREEGVVRFLECIVTEPSDAVYQEQPQRPESQYKPLWFQPVRIFKANRYIAHLVKALIWTLQSRPWCSRKSLDFGSLVSNKAMNCVELFSKSWRIRL